MAASPLGLPATAAESGFDSAEMVELGKWLFFDTRLSKDNTVSCATCHDPQTGWSNARTVGVGIGETAGTRNVPTLVNVRFLSHLFWDGRESQLVDAVARPIEHPQEMALPLAMAAARLNNIEGYKERFAAVFAGPATAEAIARSLAAFVATLEGGNAPVDRYRAGQLDALSEAARRGHDVFVFRANCQMCHRGPMFSDGDFHNLGVGMESEEPDVGRAIVTNDIDYDSGAFRTPSLRDVARTAPYMHDGSLKTLEDVVDFYEHAGILNPFRMPMLNIVPLSKQEKADLVAFLEEGLTSSDYPLVTPPDLP